MTRSVRYGAVVVMLGMLVATGHGTAWAETGGTDSHDTAVSRSQSTTDGAAEASSPSTDDATGASPGGSDPTTGTSGIAVTDDEESSTAADDIEVSEPAGDDIEVSEPAGDAASSPENNAAQPKSRSHSPKRHAITSSSTNSSTESSTDPDGPSITANSTDPQKMAQTLRLSSSATNKTLSDSAQPAGLALADSAPATTTAPATSLKTATAASLQTASTAAIAPVPGPVSPIAEITALPARIVNLVLQLAGITTSINTGPSPLSPAPFADLFFAVFRRLEQAVGLDKPVSGLPVPPSLTYTGPLTVKTPTVAQFLNAATTEYVLGGVPGGLKPFTVDGWPMTSLHLATGEDASVWVTPQSQIIIAYSGTTGGTNLLFNPLIALSQILTDFQGAFSDTTPKAFIQALDFAKQVQAEAAKQGYAREDVFVTGHSLGAWQAQYVAQQLGLAGIGFEGPGLSSTVAGNGADSLFVNTVTHGDIAGYLASDLPGLQPVAPPYVPAGGLKPHYGPIVLLGDPANNTAMTNAAALFGRGILGTLIAAVDLFGNFFSFHLPGVQAFSLDVDQDPGVTPWLGVTSGPVYTGFGDMTIPEFLKAASDAEILVAP